MTRETMMIKGIKMKILCFISSTFSIVLLGY